MWTRSLLKKNAWESLKGYYWMAFLVCIIAGFLSGSGGGGGGSVSSNDIETIMSDSTEPAEMMEELLPFLMAAFSIILIMWVIAIAFTVFVSNPIQVGLPRFFCAAREGDVNVGNLFGNFKSGRYLKTVKTMFLQQLYIFLWSLLFIIPGIIKSYEYALVPYLMSANPDLETKRALEISKQTMEGEKWNYFVLELSFIGWYLLGFMACCVGVTFVNPYYYATMAEFYTCMRAKMVSVGITTEEELTEGYAMM